MLQLAYNSTISFLLLTYNYKTKDPTNQPILGISNKKPNTFTSQTVAFGKLLKDLHSKISRNLSCCSQMEGGSIDKHVHTDNLSTLNDLKIPSH